jgi:hypothetical protein
MRHARSIATLTPAELEGWLARCYTPAAVDGLLADPDRSVVAITHAGCGISTSFEIARAAPLLTFTYNPEHWPGEPEALTGAATHFEQWMGHIAYQLYERLRARPELLPRLAMPHLELLVWLVPRYLSRRMSNLWRQYLAASLPEDTWGSLSRAIERGELDELYGDSVIDVTSQIDECLGVAKRLEWDGIYACIDLDWGGWVGSSPERRTRLMEGLEQLLGALTPLQRKGFGLKAAIPELLLDAEDARRLVRGRAVVTRCSWDEAALGDLTARYARELCGDEPHAPLITELWRELRGDFASVWGRPGPLAAVVIAAIAHEQRLFTGAPPQWGAIRHALYRTEARLRLDGDHNLRQIWRGTQAIKLDETPFSLFLRLWQRKGGFVGAEELLSMAGSQASLDKNISRVRHAIEPLASKQHWIYVKRTQTDGAWLDRETCVF